LSELLFIDCISGVGEYTSNFVSVYEVLLFESVRVNQIFFFINESYFQNFTDILFEVLIIFSGKISASFFVFPSQLESSFKFISITID
jgi:hypothetical protein